MLCSKSHGARLEPGTFEFFANALTNYAIDYLYILFWTRSTYRTWLFSAIFMYVIDIF